MVKSMSVTLLEFVVIGILLVVAWQIGVAITPWVIQRLRGLKQDLDEVAGEVQPDSTTELTPIHKEDAGSNHKYRNN
jgi:hypothetical protein